MDLLDWTYWTGLDLLDWTGLTGLDWTGLDWTGLTGLDWTRLDWSMYNSEDIDQWYVHLLTITFNILTYSTGHRHGRLGKQGELGKHS